MALARHSLLIMLALAGAALPVDSQKAPAKGKDAAPLPIEWWGADNDPKPKGGKLQEILNQAAAYEAELHFTLGKWCKKAGMNEEARRHFATACKMWREKYAQAVGEEMSDGALDKASRGSPKALLAYNHYYAKGLALLAAYYESYVRQALEENNLAEARRGANAGLTCHADQPGIRKLRGEEFIDGLGWVANERAKALRKAVCTLDKPVTDTAAHDKAHAKPDTGWMLQTRRFTIASTSTWAATKELAQGLDAFFEHLCAYFAKLLEPPASKIGIYFYGTEAEYRAHERFASWTVGSYDFSSGCVYLYKRDQSDSETVQHEITHAVLDYALTGRPVSLEMSNRQGGAHNWIFEGIAVYMQGYSSNPKEQSAVLGRQSASICALPEKCRNAEPVLALTLTQWNAATREQAEVNYAVAGALTVYCLQEKTEYREKFFNLLAEAYTREMKLDDFDAIFAMKRGEFCAEYQKWFDEVFLPRCKAELEKRHSGGK